MGSGGGPGPGSGAQNRVERYVKEYIAAGRPEYGYDCQDDFRAWLTQRIETAEAERDAMTKRAEAAEGALRELTEKHEGWSIQPLARLWPDWHTRPGRDRIAIGATNPTVYGPEEFPCLFAYLTAQQEPADATPER